MPPKTARDRMIDTLSYAALYGTVYALGIAALFYLGKSAPGWRENYQTVMESPVTQECIIEKATVTDPSSLVLDIAIQDTPAGTETEGSIGPFHFERTVIDDAKPNISSEASPDRQYTDEQYDKLFAFDTDGMHDEGSSIYEVDIAHKVKTTEGLGPQSSTEYEIIQEPCGSIEIGIYNGFLKLVSIVEQ